VLTSPGHQGKAYALTGPEALSGDEVAERLSAATGRQVGSVDVAADTFGQALVGAGLPGWLVERLVELNIMMADGHAAGVTDEVARLTGRQPRTFAQFAAEHRAIFGGQQ
jgi:prepilin-type processing-associated H-X9-DG protein